MMTNGKDVILAETKKKAIDQLNQQVTACTNCRLSRTRTNALCGEGNLNTRLLLVALSPGKKEDVHNKMFIGPSGRVLDMLLEGATISRDLIYMTNLIKCILPKNRKPKMDEIHSCSHFLKHEIAIIRPQIIVPLGYYAIRSILTIYHADQPPARKDISELHGRLIVSEGQMIFPLPHPSSLLYCPAFEPEAMKNYKKLFILLHE